MQKQLVEKVNFAGHYRLYISDHGEFPEDCGINSWVCGWIIDKEAGKVITEFPLFNGNTKYYSTIENNTPSPDPFLTEFYANINLIWVNGENIPAKKIGRISPGGNKCSNNTYVFNGGIYSIVFRGNCAVTDIE
ncbi:hypothetical protein G9X43_04860 [Cronobacter turicensis]|uniref:hypothetical protein n=1 Tax=Cronobacter turicensis TaxID=413502 RepID=UPI001413466D|nr:hypothetical protein [Cronobacter turicensis]NHV08876.1 hypothetical protein [Cronobacter turicensis]NHV62238.1 hypothetical protein [Cronobacter turicensis]NHW09179.1 hypothetical protein [Cronobacter turicensis]